MTTMRCCALMMTSLAVLLTACPATETVDAGARDSGSVEHDAASAIDSGATDALVEQYDGAVIGGVRVYEDNVDSMPTSTMVGVELWGLFDRPFPLQIFGVVREGLWEVTLSAGACVYLTPAMAGFCTPECTTEQYCDVDDVCQSYPVRQSAGTLTLTGLTAPVTLEPTMDNFYTASGTPTENLFEPGSMITLTAEGATLPAFDVSTTAVAPLAPAIPCPLELIAGQDLTVTWDAATGGNLIRWEMISAFHAGDGPMVLCEGPDTGSLVVPASIVDRYLIDRTPYETMQLSRLQHAATGAGNGRLFVLEAVSMRICF